ncbi:MAG: hypothetical protein WEB88_01575 [Gemmatimonadota bacterium]
MTSILFLAAAALVIAGGLAARRRVEEARESRRGLADEDIRRIEEGGWVELDEPLDLDEARAEEEQFWEETWDEPEDPF